MLWHNATYLVQYHETDWEWTKPKKWSHYIDRYALLISKAAVDAGEGDDVASDPHFEGWGGEGYDSVWGSD